MYCKAYSMRSRTGRKDYSSSTRRGCYRRPLRWCLPGEHYRRARQDNRRARPSTPRPCRAILDRQRQAFVADGPAERRVCDATASTGCWPWCSTTPTPSSTPWPPTSAPGPVRRSLFTEVVGMIPVIEHTRPTSPNGCGRPQLMRGGRVFGLRAEVESTPLGVVGIIGPWNFPLNLVVLPASAAFAAGNRVMIKMSEVTPRTAELMKRLAPQVLRPRRTSCGDRRSGRCRRVRDLPFDHLFFTGSPSVGALVQRRGLAEPRPGHAGTRWQEPGRGGARCRRQTLGDADRQGAHGQRRPGVRLSGLRLRAG